MHTVRLLLGGLGRGSYDGAVCPIGITVTALAELALPVFLLAAGTAVTASAPVRALLADSEGEPIGLATPLLRGHPATPRE